MRWIVAGLLMAISTPIAAAAPLSHAAAVAEPIAGKPSSKPCAAGRIALTFDDGPSAKVTPRLVGVLRDLKVPATFFMVGSRVDASPATARLVERSGFLIASHSYLHQNMTRQSDAEIAETLRRTDAAFQRAGLHPTRLMRPPYGDANARVLAVVRRQGKVPVMWNVDSRDWTGGDGAQIAARVLAQIKPGSRIVLQHDGVGNSANSVAAVPRIVREARARGFCFVALDERGNPGYPTPSARLSVEPADRHVTEGDTLKVIVTLDRQPGRDTSVSLRLKGRNASLRHDIKRPARLIRFPAGTLSRTIAIPITEDDLDEGKERFDIWITDGEGVRPRRGATTIVITDAR